MPPDVQSLCLICRRIKDDPIHDPVPRQGRVGDEPRIEQHAFDPGERRHGTRRKSDRQS
jgi:hypothetical protein